MADIVTPLYVVQGGAGGETGADIDNAMDLPDMITYLNTTADTLPTGGVDIYLCGDFTTSAELDLTASGENGSLLKFYGRNATGTAAALSTIDADGGGFNVWRFECSYTYVQQLKAYNTDGELDSNGFGVGAADLSTGFNIFALCEAEGCRQGFWSKLAPYCCVFYGCRGYGNVRGFGDSAANGYGTAVACVSHGNDHYGFYGMGSVVNSVAYGNGDGTSNDAGFGYCHNVLSSTAYNNNPHGVVANIASDTVNGTYCRGVLSASNTTDAFHAATKAVGHLFLHRCADYGNTQRYDPSSTKVTDVDPIVLTADPFVDAANGDFRLNNRAGGGRLLRNIAWTLPGNGNIAYPDIGALQVDGRTYITGEHGHHVRGPVQGRHGFHQR